MFAPEADSSVVSAGELSLAATTCSTAPKAKNLSSCCGLITLRLSLNLFEGGTGCHEWEAGFFLAEFVFSFPDLFKGASCCLLPA